MKFKDIDIPDELIEAVKSNRLVVFAGAGVSMGEPCSLPNFRDLCELIGSGTGLEIEEEEHEDVYLGKLQDKGVDIKRKSADILNCNKKYNELHGLIVNLFKGYENIKIITTNFDPAFENYFAEDISKVNCYTAPALPLGEDFSGLVYMHGSLKKPETMIISDKDFGFAYITKGYVSKFLVDVFQNYHVLFIGYSFNDQVMSYLTRGLAPANNSFKRFILHEEIDFGKFMSLGIKPISFPKGRFDILNDLVKYIGTVANRDLVQWNKVYCEHQSVLPKDLLLLEAIKYSLHNEDCVRVFTNSVNEPKWVDWVKENQLIYDLSIDSKINNLWMDWIIKCLLGKYDDELVGLIERCHLSSNAKFGNLLLDKLCSQSDIDKHFVQVYIIIFKQFIVNEYLLFRLLHWLITINHIEIAYDLYKLCFNYRINITKNSLGDSVELHFITNDILIRDFWNGLKQFVIKNKVKDFAQFIINKLIQVLNEVKLLNGSEPYSFRANYFPLEDNERIYDNTEQCIMCMINALIHVLNSLDKSNKFFILSILEDLYNSEISLCRSLALKILRTTNLLDVYTKFNLYWKYFGLFDDSIHDQSFLLVADIYPSLSQTKKKEIVNKFNKVIKSAKKEPNQNERKLNLAFQWCDWLSRKTTDEYFLNTKYELMDDFGFVSSKNPERYYISHEVNIVEEKGTLSDEKIKQMSSDEIAYYLNNFKEDRFNDRTLRGANTDVSKCFLSNFDICKDEILSLLDKVDVATGFWSVFIYQLSSSDVAVTEKFEIIKLIREYDSIVKNNGRAITQCLQSVIKDKANSEFVIANCAVIFNILKCIVNNGNPSYYDIRTCDFNVFNNSVGEALYTLILLFYNNRNYINTKDYLDYFEQLLCKELKDHEIIVTLLLGYFNVIYSIDSNWAMEKLVPYLDCNHRDYVFAWSGLCIYCSYFTVEEIYILIDQFKQAVPNIGNLDKEVRKRFVQHYCLMLLYVGDSKNVTDIINLFNQLIDEECAAFTDIICDYFKEQEQDKLSVLWNKWVKQHASNRIQGQPIAVGTLEKKSILYLTLELNGQFPEMVNIICDSGFKASLDDYFILKLRETMLVVEYRDNVLKIITYLLDFGDHDNVFINELNELINDMQLTTTNVSTELQNKLLRIGITLKSE